MRTMSINGKTYRADVPDDMPLLWVLRDVPNVDGRQWPLAALRSAHSAADRAGTNIVHVLT